MKPCCIVLVFNGTHWSFQTFVGAGQLINFGDGYLTASTAMLQAQIFTVPNKGASYGKDGKTQGDGTGDGTEGPQASSSE